MKLDSFFKEVEKGSVQQPVVKTEQIQTNFDKTSRFCSTENLIELYDDSNDSAGSSQTSTSSQIVMSSNKNLIKYCGGYAVGYNV
jgi:hypothetical protein